MRPLNARRGRSRAGGGNRRQQHSPNRSYDSNGPSVRIRGTAAQVYDKYCTLARDANTSGDRIAAENFLQHAEHYYRLMSAASAGNSNGNSGGNNGSGQRQQPDQQEQREQSAEQGQGDNRNRPQAETPERRETPVPGTGPQPTVAPPSAAQPSAAQPPADGEQGPAQAAPPRKSRGRGRSRSAEKPRTDPDAAGHTEAGNEAEKKAENKAAGTSDDGESQEAKEIHAAAD